MKTTRLIFYILSTALVVGMGCARKPAPDPLAGWQLDFSPSRPSDKIIEKDYENYIQELPSGEKNSAVVSGYFEDARGQHAIKLQTSVNGTVWLHVLIYDKDNKRIKTIKYAIGQYAS
jgi:hypothetical protein